MEQHKGWSLAAVAAIAAPSHWSICADVISCLHRPQTRHLEFPALHLLHHFNGRRLLDF